MPFPVIKIAQPSLFSFSECLWYLNRNYDDCLHQINAHSLTKAIKLSEKPALIKVTADDSDILVEVQAGNTSAQTLAKIRKYVIDWFDVERDLTPFYQLLENDEQLCPLSQAYYGLRLISIHNVFEALCWSIIGQQINLTFAYRLKRRLVESFGESLRFEDQVFYLFPTPEQLAAVQLSELLPLQFSTRKAEYLLGLAQLFVQGSLSKEMLTKQLTTQEKIQTLTAIRGIGEWTANYTLLKSLKEMTCIPYGDAGLNKALKITKGLEKYPDRAEVNAIFEPFKGWEAYLVFYLWRSLS